MVNKLLWSCAALLTLLVTVESLTCNTCDATVLGYCFRTEPQNCTKAQDNCFSGVTKFSSADMLDIHSKGCIAHTSCKNSTGHLLNVNYTITMHCCKSNRCNGAAAVRMPLTTAVAAALLAIWTRGSL